MRILFRAHALQRLIERRITKECAKKILKEGTIIESYPDDRPYGSYLALGWCGDRPIHIVYAKSDEALIIITAYEPDPAKWSADFTQRI